MPDPSSPAPRICFLLALWGGRYIKTFCELSLASLLAEGNIPSLAREFECSFCLLTRKEDIPEFERQPLFPLLKRYCKIEYVGIEDIIFDANYSATLTVALERGIRRQGEAALGTYFVFLMGDYLFAGNALTGLIPHIKSGVSAVTAGNYQVVEEKAAEELRRRVNPQTGILDIPNRELVGWSFRHLSPTTLANTVNLPQTHMRHVNRLFWRVDAKTMIGRFYLRHTLCLRPERLDYVIGAPWDYAFLPEMCPSGRVAHIADSDEYFVLELQPLLHEAKLIAPGPPAQEFIARSLGEWTTAPQRRNAHHAVVYHADDIPPEVSRMVEESEEVIRQLEQRLSVPPFPVRGHFHWLDCVNWLTTDIARSPASYGRSVAGLKENVWESKVFSPPLKEAGLALDRFPPLEPRATVAEPPENARNRQRFMRLYAVYRILFGQPPEVRLWHPRYFDYRLLSDALGGRSRAVLMVLEPTRAQWMIWNGIGSVMRSPLIMERDIGGLRGELASVGACIIHLPQKYDFIFGKLMNVLGAALPEGCPVHIYIAPSFLRPRPVRPQRILRNFAHLESANIRFVARASYPGTLRRRLDRAFRRTGNRFLTSYADGSFAGMAWYAAQIALWHVVYGLHNAVIYPFRASTSERSGDTVCSTVLTYKAGGGR